MNLSSIAGNPQPDPLAWLASRPRTKNQSAGAIDERDRAIRDALASGAQPSAVADATGLAVRTIQRIVTGQPRRYGERDRVRIPSLGGGSTDIPRLGAVQFDQASPMALAVLGAGRDTCRWPMGEGEDFRFCGARAVASKSGGLTLRSFCAEHAALAYRGQARVVAEAA